MSDSRESLSRLKIDREQEAPSGPRAAVPRRALAWIGGALLLAGGLWLLLRSMGAGAIEVRVVPVVSVGGGAGGDALGAGVTANGYVVARTKASVSSKISGRLEFLGVEEGSHVKKGEVIGRLEGAEYRAAVAQARAELRRARASLREAEAQRDQLRRDLARLEALLPKEYVSRQEVENTSTALAAAEARVGVQGAQVGVAEAALGVAHANLENTLIRAPFDGTVLRRDAEVGEVVAAAATGSGLVRGAVVTMANLKTLEVEVDVNEAYIGQLRPDQPARIYLDAYPAHVYRGQVRQIVPTADRQRATVQVKVAIVNPDSRILPEMAARVEFIAGEAEGSAGKAEGAGGKKGGTVPRIFVPVEAVQEVAGESVVWVIRDGRARRRTVNAGPSSGGRREIRSGLSAGERIVLDAPAGLKEGAEVRVVEAAAPDK